MNAGANEILGLCKATRFPSPPARHVADVATGVEAICDLAKDFARCRPPRPRNVPYTQIKGNATLHFEVRTAGDPAAWVPAVRRAVSDYSPGLALLQPMTQQAEFDQNFSDQRVSSGSRYSSACWPLCWWPPAYTARWPTQ